MLSLTFPVARLTVFTVVLLTTATVVQGQQPGSSNRQDSDHLADSERKHTESGEHVQEQLNDIIKQAKDTLKQIKAEVKDYECILIKQERIKGKMQAMQFLQTKIRHPRDGENGKKIPFSVYVKFLKPADVLGREVIFVEGANNNDLIARRGGRRYPNMTFQFPPDGAQAMNGNRYPITQIGIATMIERLLVVLEEKIDPENCHIKRFDDAKLDGRPCTHYEVTLPEKTPTAIFMKAHLFVDNETNMPTFYASYDWPLPGGDKPRLVESYIYRNIKTNVGLTDKDFDRTNPEYQFSDTQPDPKDSK